MLAMAESGGDEGIRTLDLLSASYFKSRATIEFQQLRVARCGETWHETALSAPYTHPGKANFQEQDVTLCGRP